MLKLDIKTEPYWLDLPGKVKIKVKPISTAIMSAAWSMALDGFRRLADSGNTDASDETLRKGLIDSLLIKALARLAIIEWQGVLLANGEEVAPLTEQNISDLMDIWVVGREFLDTYSLQLKLLETEGNVLATAANGTSAAEALTAQNAE